MEHAAEGQTKVQGGVDLESDVERAHPCSEPSFPPSPPNAFSNSADDTPLPKFFRNPAGYTPLPEGFWRPEDLSDGSFSRVSFGSEFAAENSQQDGLQFPEDWEDGSEPSVDLVSGQPPSPQSCNEFLHELLEEDISDRCEHLSQATAWGPPELSVSACFAPVSTPSVAHAEPATSQVCSSALRGDAAGGVFTHDALGSLVGSLVKHDVAKFGSADDGLKLPWETDFARTLLDPDRAWDPLKGVRQDSRIPPITQFTRGGDRPKTQAKEVPPGSIFAWAIALGAAARDPAAERERKFEQGVSMWSRLVMRYSGCCSLYECVAEDLSEQTVSYEAVVKAVSAAVGVKSPHTIHKRASSFWSFVRWLDVHDPIARSRLSEAQVWSFVQFLKETSAPASKASSVLSAFRFAHFVLGFKVSSIIESKRIGGATQQQLVNLRKLRQAKDLTVSQILELHARLESGSLHKFDRALLASLLIRLYTRARPSDFLFIESVEVDCPPGADYPLLVFEVSQHKGARKVQLKTLLLPILVPMIGVHGKCWIEDALSAFKEAGRSLTLLRGPLTFAPTDESGVASSRRSISSAEVGRALRAFLGVPEEVVSPNDPRLTAYSLRGTCLGWGGKYGFDEDLKSILGRHASSVKTTQAIYSRELSAAPARRFQDMLREVAEGRFFPDNSRSSYFPKQSERPKVLSPEPTVPKSGTKTVKIEVISSDESEAEKPPSSDEGSSDSSQSSRTSSTSSASEAIQPTVRRWKRARVEVPNQVWYVNASSGVLHLLAGPEDVPMLLACGRPVTENYREATHEEISRGKECRTCRRNV